MTRPKSAELFERAQRVIPGGVNSPVRAFRSVGGTPVFVSRAAGAHIYGADGEAYVDYVGSWGPAILGHAVPEVLDAAMRAAALGSTYGAPTEAEVRFAEALIALYPSMEMLRAVSSGTEATMAALRVARGFTGRELVVKFEGCYHGHADFLLVKAGSGAATLGTPDSAGVPEAIARATITCAYNDKAALTKLFDEVGSRIAAVIVEPCVGNMGLVAPEEGFLEHIIALCKQHGAVSVFDEVMTGCRVHASGMQGRMGLKPDMTTLGKIVGGGFPLAAYGGRREIMQCIAPVGAVYQAGTLSGNPVAVAAGLQTLKMLTPAVYERLEVAAARLENGLVKAIADVGVAARVQRMGSMLTVFFSDKPVRDWASANLTNRAAFAVFHKGLLERGIYWPPAAFEAAFVSAAHTDEHIDETLRAAHAALTDVKAAGH